MLLALSYIGSTINDQSQVTNDRLQYKHDKPVNARNVRFSRKQTFRASCLMTRLQHNLPFTPSNLYSHFRPPSGIP